MNSKTSSEIPKLTTALGSVPATVLHEDGSSESITISQLKLSQYAAAIPLLDDEFALISLICGKDKAWALTLAPESYESVQELAQGLNLNGFFRYAGRQLAMKSLKATLAGASNLEKPSSPLPPRPR